MNSNPEWRITQLIRQKTEGPGEISINQLNTEINEANSRAGTRCKVTVGLLYKIKRGDLKVGLTKGAMIALGTYFPELNLMPPFVVPGVLDGLAGTPKLVFMLGAKPRPKERRNDISHWDALSLAELLTDCSKRRPNEIDIEYVLWRSPVKPETIVQEPWAAALDDDECSVVSIGSPMASLSSELMLARMFKVRPFTEPQFRTANQVPFCFVWRPEVVKGFKSAFGLAASGLEALDAAVAADVKKNRAAAFIQDDKIYAVPVKGTAWTMHGIIAAQRRATGNVWLVVSGLAGPATCGAAKKVKDVMDELPWAKGQPSKVLWVPVKVEIHASKSSSADGDVRRIASVDFDGPARIWPA